MILILHKQAFVEREKCWPAANLHILADRLLIQLELVQFIISARTGLRKMTQVGSSCAVPCELQRKPNRRQMTQDHSVWLLPFVSPLRP